MRDRAPPPHEGRTGQLAGRPVLCRAALQTAAAAGMERELEALAPRPAEPPPPAPPWQALLEALGGRGQVLLVGELWEREQSRALLRDFARALFPSEPAGRGAEPAIPPGVPAQGGPGQAATRAIRSPLVFVLCRAASLGAREPRRAVQEMLRDVRGRRRAGAALVAVLVAEAAPDDAGTHPAGAMRRLEALLRSVFGRQVGGPVLAAAYRPDRPASCLDVQAAACRALQAAGPLRPGETRRWENIRGQDSHSALEHPARLETFPPTNGQQARGRAGGVGVSRVARALAGVLGIEVGSGMKGRWASLQLPGGGIGSSHPF